MQEIKDLKANLRLRDEKIEGLISQVNQLGIAVNDTETENEELRERLGLDPKKPLDTEAIKEKKLIKTQQQAALNRVLSKEVGTFRLVYPKAIIMVKGIPRVSLHLDLAPRRKMVA